MKRAVRVHAEILEQMAEAARRSPLQECCGLLGGRDGVISVLCATRNQLASPTAFEIAPGELFRVFRRFRAEGWEHLGIYHSHLSGELVPSPRDIECAYYPEAAYFIVSPQGETKRAVRAFRIIGDRWEELEIQSV